MKDTTKRAHGSARATGLDLIATFDDGRVVRFEIPTQGALVIGRDADADGVLDDASVSRKHVRLQAGATPTIEDLDSTNGTRVSGLPLVPGKTMDLRVGAVVEIGDVVLFVRPRGTAAVTVPPTHAASVTIMPAGVVVEDPALRAMYELVPRIARSKISVLVLGETGTGKDVFAETVHRASERAQAPFAHQLRGAFGIAARGRALRFREGLVHRRATGQRRPLRGGQRRYRVPRRNRRNGGYRASQAAARFGAG